MVLNRQAKLNPGLNNTLNISTEHSTRISVLLSFYGWEILPQHQKIFLKKAGDCFFDIPSSILLSSDLYSSPTY